MKNEIHHKDRECNQDQGLGQDRERDQGKERSRAKVINLRVQLEGWTLKRHPRVVCDHPDFKGKSIVVTGIPRRQKDELRDGEWHQVSVSEPQEGNNPNFLLARFRDNRDLYQPFLPKMTDFDLIFQFNEYLEKNKFFSDSWGKSKVFSLLKVPTFTPEIVEKLLTDNEKVDDRVKRHLESCNDLIYLKKRGEYLPKQESHRVRDLELLQELGLICSNFCNDTIHLADKCKFEKRVLESIQGKTQDGFMLKPLSEIKDFTPTPEQKQFISWLKTNDSKVISLLGVGGSGKTYTLGKILETKRVLALAPTHKAKNNLQASGFENVSTLQKCVASSMEDADSDANYDVILIDEISMVTLEMLDAFFQGFKYGCRFIFIGDDQQLPPISADQEALEVCGNVINLLRTYGSVFEFKDNHRCHDPHVKAFIQAVRDKNESFLTGHTAMFMDSFSSMIAYKERHLALSQCMIICHTNETVARINEWFYNHLSRDIVDKTPFYRKLDRSGRGGFFVGAQVVFYENDDSNDHGYTNSEFGVVEKMKLDLDEEESEIVVKIDNGKIYRLPLKKAESDLRLAYAITIHKSQGSGSHKVYVLEAGDHGLAYTAVSRSKSKLALVEITEKSWLEAVNTESPVKMNLCNLKKSHQLATPSSSRSRRKRATPINYLSDAEEISDMLKD